MSHPCAAGRHLVAPVAIVAFVVAGCGAPNGRGAGATQPLVPRTRSSAATTAPPLVPRATGAATPAHPAVRTAASVPALSARARAAGLLDVRTIVPDAVIDLRYKTRNNFTHVALYPATARCLVHRSMSSGLTTAAARLRRAGYLLVFWDCYRPHKVQQTMFRIYPDPNFVARPGPSARSHEAARSVDVTIARRAPSQTCPAARRVQRHCLVSMNTDFDSFSSKAAAFATKGVTRTARVNRTRLRAAMKAGGIRVYAGEWWHFDGPGAAVPRPHLNAPLS